MFETPVFVTQPESPSRTYMIGVYDPINPNEVRFEKVKLPQSGPNSVKEAKMYYLYHLTDIEDAETTRIMSCVAIEEYIRATHSVFTLNDKEDIEQALRMLFSWNSDQKNPAESYTEVVNILLKRVVLTDSLDDKFAKLKEVASEILKIE